MTWRWVAIGLLGVALPAAPAPALAADALQTLVQCSEVAKSAQRLACYDDTMPKIRAELAPGASDASKDDQVSLFGLNLSSLSNILGPAPRAAAQPSGQGRLAQPRAPAAPSAPAGQAIAQPVAPSRAQPIDRIGAVVSDYSLTPLGRFVVFLDNGQVWRQLDADTARAPFKRAAADNKVSISRGSFGTFNLQLNGDNALFKVARVK